MELRLIEMLPTLSFLFAVFTITGVGLVVLPWTERELAASLGAWRHAVDLLVARVRHPAAARPMDLPPLDADALLPAPMFRSFLIDVADFRSATESRLAAARERVPTASARHPARHPAYRVLRLRT